MAGIRWTGLYTRVPDLHGLDYPGIWLNQLFQANVLLGLGAGLELGIWTVSAGLDFGQVLLPFLLLEVGRLLTWLLVQHGLDVLGLA